MRRPCSIEGCDRPVDSHGWCATHVRRWRRYGTPTPEHLPAVPPRVQKRATGSLTVRPVPGPLATPCLMPLKSDGTVQSWYGQVCTGGTVVAAHRFNWEQVYGPIPDGKIVCHVCDNPPCCNVGHLVLCTYAENAADAVTAGRHRNARKTHCHRGHEFTDENTYVAADASRTCRACHRQAARASYHRRTS